MDAMLLEGTVRPLTGYLLCYIPLATVIIGLITLFVLTDRHASRPYLRYNPFVAAGSTDQEIAARTPAVGETPAGPLSGAAAAGETTVFLGEHGATVAVPKEAVPPAAPAVGAQVTRALAITYVEFNPAGSDVEGEYVRIANNTNSAITMTGWTLRDEGRRHSFTFPSFMIAPGAVVQLWTKSGQNDTTNLYWGQRGAVWNNTGDTAVLLDVDGKEVSRFSY